MIHVNNYVTKSVVLMFILESYNDILIFIKTKPMTTNNMETKNYVHITMIIKS